MPNTFPVTYSGCGTSGSLSLSLVSTQDITLLCSSQTSLCSGGTSPYGIELYRYDAVVTLPSGCNSWTFSAETCCRNASITNLSAPSSNGFYISTQLNNTLTPCNSSPVFASTPTPFVCVNQPVYYQQLAFDPDGDSLVYSLTNCLSEASTVVSYLPGFSGASPLTNPVNINPATGEMTFTATTAQTAAICVRVEEYRNGVKIGEIIRDLQFVIQNCTNQAPVLGGINNVPNTYSISTCEGTDLCFTVPITDVNAGDLVNATYSGNIPGATFTQTGSGNNRTGTFCWTAPVGGSGSYFFSVIATDNACPVPGQSARTYTVNVIPNPNPPVNAGPDVALCSGSSTVLTASSAATNISSVQWSPTVGLSNPNSLSTTATPSATTTYSVTMNYTDGCSSTDNVTVTINADPVANASPGTASVCPGGSIILTGTTNVSGMTFLWLSPTLTSLGPGLVTGATSSINVSLPTTPGTYNYTLRVTNPTTGCSTDDIVSITVGAPPSLPACTNIYVSPTGTAGAAGTQAAPTSLAEALNRAACQNAVIKMATGTYNVDFALTINSYVTIEGGFNPATGWTKTSQAGATTINRTTSNPEGVANALRIVAFYGNSVTGFRFQDVTITTAAANQPGMSTYGVHLTNCSNYNFIRTQILPGAAAAGAGGATGTAGVTGGNGGGGLGGSCDGGTCTFSSGNAGAAGGSGGAGAGGAAAGTGGAAANGAQNNGNAGNTGPGRNGGGGGGGGAGGDECSTNNAGNGGNGGGTACTVAGGGGTRGGEGDPGGTGANGTIGTTGASGTIGAAGAAGTHTGNFWVPGAQGGTGTDGCGGRGGGGGGGGGRQVCTFCDNGQGNGGGGGGGGGQGGTGGTGGRGGGSSYGLYLALNGASGIVNQSRVVAGTAGAGGVGGAGGNGGNGGTGGVGGSTCTGEIGRGGTGGAGGPGGNGGAGGAGQPGQSIAIHLQSGTALATNVSNFNLPGQPTITVTNVNCTNTNVTYTTAAAGAWDFDLVGNAAAPATAGAIPSATTQYSQIARYSVSVGVNTYTGFHNVSYDGATVPVILSNANQLGVDTFQLCVGQFASFESQYTANSYVWNFNGAVANPGSVRITNATQFNTPGFYPVTLNLVTDCCGLSSTKTVYLFVDRRPTPTGSGNVPICLGSSATLSLSGLNASDSVVWSPTDAIIQYNSNSVVVRPTATTTFTATVYNEIVTAGQTRLSCPTNINFVVTVNTLPVSAAVLTQPICGSDGQVRVNVSSAGTYNFTWSNGGSSFGTNTSAIAGLNQGLYTVTITNTATGCSTTRTEFLFASPLAPSVFAQSTTAATCGLNNGTAQVNTTGGTAPFTYAWSSGGAPTPTRINLAGGTYCVTVTDNNGCTSRTCFQIAATGTVSLTTIASTNPTCVGVANGALQVEASGGRGLYDFTWSTGATTPAVSGLAIGTYTVTVTDADGCTATRNLNLTAATTPTILANSNSPVCNGSSITLSATGANTYTWTGPNGYTATGAYPSVPAAGSLAAGTYNVTGTTTVGCTANASTVVVVNTCPEICGNGVDDDNDGLVDLDDNVDCPCND
jgi:hypothetical protein